MTAMQQHADLVALWEEHISAEFATGSVEDTLATMSADAYVNHVPVLAGGVGTQSLRSFYGLQFIPKMPSDTCVELISRTVGSDRIVDEMFFKFTHILHQSG